MIHNTIWVAGHEDQVLKDGIDRRLGIETKWSDLLELGVWGIKEQWLDDTDRMSVVREVHDEATFLTALTSKPMLIEVVNTNTDESFMVSWDGHGWLLSELKTSMKTDSDEEYTDENGTEWVRLQSTDLEALEAKALQDIGLSYITASMVRDRNINIEFVSHDSINTDSLTGTHFYYQTADTTEVKYVCGKTELPNPVELDLLHCINDGVGGDTVYIFFNDTGNTLSDVIDAFDKLSPPNYTIGHHTETQPIDIVDLHNFVKSTFLTEPLSLDVFFVLTQTEEKGSIHFFINMSRFFPTEAPFIAS